MLCDMYKSCQGTSHKAMESTPTTSETWKKSELKFVIERVYSWAFT